MSARIAVRSKQGLISAWIQRVLSECYFTPPSLTHLSKSYQRQEPPHRSRIL